MSLFLDNFKQQLSSEGILHLSLKVIPNAKKTEWIGILEHSGSCVLKVRISAKPLKNLANQELIKFLAAEFGVKKSQVQILSGQTSTHKLIQIRQDS